MADVIVVTGPPGAGKSTVAPLVADARSPSVLVPGDAFFAWVWGGVAPWLPEAREQNAVTLRAAAAAVGGFAAGPATVVYDGVLVPPSVRRFTADAGLDTVHYAVLLPPLAACLRRVAERTGHGFTDPDATRHMYAEFADAELEERHVLRDPPDRPQDVAEELLRRHSRGLLARCRDHQ